MTCSITDGSSKHTGTSRQQCSRRFTIVNNSQTNQSTQKISRLRKTRCGSNLPSKSYYLNPTECGRFCVDTTVAPYTVRSVHEFGQCIVIPITNRTGQGNHIGKVESGRSLASLSPLRPPHPSRRNLAHKHIFLAVASQRR